MKNKARWISAAIGICLGITAYGIYFLRAVATVQPANASGSADVILNTILTGYNRWHTLQGDAQFTWYDSQGGTPVYTDEFVLSQPASAYVNITNLSQPGHNESITIADGQAMYTLDKTNQTYTRAAYSIKPEDLSQLPQDLPQVQPGTVYMHPMALQISAPIMEYLYSSWYAQQKTGDAFALARNGRFLSRDAWIVDHQSSTGDRDTAWIDQNTGIILQFHQIQNGKPFLDVVTKQITQISTGPIGSFTDTILWSQDGNQLILSCTTGNSSISQVYRLDPSSGAFSPLTGFTTGEPNAWVLVDSWDDDETTIGLTTVVAPSQGGLSQGILQLLDVKTGQVKTILDEQHSGSIEWLGGTYLTHDGKTIFFEGRMNGRSRIFRIDVDGTHLAEVTSDDLSYDVQGPIIFSPDGQSFFASAPDQGLGQSNSVPSLFSIQGDLLRQLTDFPGKVVAWIKPGN